MNKENRKSEFDDVVKDSRYLSIKDRLCLLPSDALKQFLGYTRPVVYDSLNYRIEDSAYCPIAIMVGVENILKDREIKPNQESVLSVLKEHEAFGTVKGIEGEFYRENRETDIKWLCQQILNERGS